MASGAEWLARWAAGHEIHAVEAPEVNGAHIRLDKLDRGKRSAVCSSCVAVNLHRGHGPESRGLKPKAETPCSGEQVDSREVGSSHAADSISLPRRIKCDSRLR